MSTLLMPTNQISRMFLTLRSLLTWNNKLLERKVAHPQSTLVAKATNIQCYATAVCSSKPCRKAPQLVDKEVLEQEVH